MPNERSLQNLVMFTSDQDKKKASENGKKGGAASGAARRARRTLKDELLALLVEEVARKDGSRVTVQESITSALLKKANSGDVKAFEVIRDTVGEKPIERKEIVSEVTPEKIAYVKNILDQIQKAEENGQDVGDITGKGTTD